MTLPECPKKFDDICIRLDSISQRDGWTEMVKQYREPIVSMLMRSDNTVNNDANDAENYKTNIDTII